MSRTVALVVGSCLSVLSAAPVAATTLATVVFPFDVATNFSGPASGARIDVCFGPASRCQWLFGGSQDPLTTGVIVGDQDDGVSFTADAGPLFDFAVATLTNGIDDRIGILVGFAPGTSTGYFLGPETSLLNVAVPGANGIDLGGFEITSITLSVPEIKFFRSFGNASTSGTIIITIAGVPEPSTGALVALGVASIAARRRALLVRGPS